jgi:hypothetical protein
MCFYRNKTILNLEEKYGKVKKKIYFFKAWPVSNTDPDLKLMPKPDLGKIISNSHNTGFMILPAHFDN